MPQLSPVWSPRLFSLSDRTVLDKSFSQPHKILMLFYRTVSNQNWGSGGVCERNLKEDGDVEAVTGSVQLRTQRGELAQRKALAVRVTIIKHKWRRDIQETQEGQERFILGIGLKKGWRKLGWR